MLRCGNTLIFTRWIILCSIFEILFFTRCIILCSIFEILFLFLVWIAVHLLLKVANHGSYITICWLLLCCSLLFFELYLMYVVYFSMTVDVWQYTWQYHQRSGNGEHRYVYSCRHWLTATTSGQYKFETFKPVFSDDGVQWNLIYKQLCIRL